MQVFPDDVKFRFSWRPYQARVLSELDAHMDDKRLHVVAAPASGKTVLGLEVVRRLNGPTLVLAPTLAIRDQWVQRLEELFLPSGSQTPDWVSFDLGRPGFFTVSTYQMLHSAIKRENVVLDEEAEAGEAEKSMDIAANYDNEDGEDTEEELDADENRDYQAHVWLDQKRSDYRSLSIPELAPMLIQLGIRTVVLDEAHHLRSSWWNSLTTLIKEIGNISILALTATPPYDVPPAEWERYMELCGPVDAEISVPELVKVKNLCPHQDLVVFSSPSDTEMAQITKFRDNIVLFVNDPQVNETIGRHIMSQRWIQNPNRYISEILEEPDLFTSMLVFLNHINEVIPLRALNLIADSIDELPPFSYEWMEVLLTGIFYPRSGKQPTFKSEMETIRENIKGIHAVEGRKIILRSPRFVEKLLKRSISKLDSVVDIANTEFSSYGHRLRMVILADFVRKAYLPSTRTPLPDIDKIGVVPIFESLRRSNFAGAKLGVLTGSIIIIPSEAEEQLRELALKSEITGNDIDLTPYPSDDSYQIVKVLSQDHHKMVRVITELFSTGGINILVGTKSLLGEGWDAPSINSLVISSVVGSYMLSNQMRGRAIRVQPGNPSKTANIWHLVCVEPNSSTPGVDFDTIVRRFRAFVGVSRSENIIENGFGRLMVGDPPFSSEDIWEINDMMFDRSIKRDLMRDAWDDALGDDEQEIRLIEDVQFSANQLPYTLVSDNVRGTLYLEAVCLAILAISNILRLQQYPSMAATVGTALTLFFAFLVTILAMPSLLSLHKYFKHSTPKRSFRSVAKAVVSALQCSALIGTYYPDPNLMVQAGADEKVYCHLRGVNRRDESVFLQALQEVLSTIDDPRYFLSKRTITWFGVDRIDHFAVPRVLGSRKKNALEFQNAWKRQVQSMNLIYTRNSIGRLELLKARTKSMIALKGFKSERVTRWI